MDAKQNQPVTTPNEPDIEAPKPVAATPTEEQKPAADSK
jgi:hypothetical protein